MSYGNPKKRKHSPMKKDISLVCVCIGGGVCLCVRLFPYIYMLSDIYPNRTIRMKAHLGTTSIMQIAIADYILHRIFNFFFSMIYFKLI